MTNQNARVKVTHYMPKPLLDWMRVYCKANAVAQSRLLTLLVQEFQQGVLLKGG